MNNNTWKQYQSQLNSMPELDRNYIILHIKANNLFDIDYLSQETQGMKLGVSRKTVNEISTKLAPFVIKKNRGVMMTCTYEVAPFMYEPDFIREYGFKFPELVWCPKALLSATFRGKVTQAIYKDIYKTKRADFIANNLQFMTSVNQAIYSKPKSWDEKYGLALKGGGNAPCPREFIDWDLILI
jgi:hypothetical protein